MPLTVIGGFFPAAAAAVAEKVRITSWTRLEVQPGSSDFAASLAAKIADPLWSLTRQWQFGELNGEDAGSPVEVRLDAEQSNLSRFHPGPLAGRTAAATLAGSRDYVPAAQPLETLVEAEDAALAGPFAGIVAGQHFVRMLAAAGQSAALDPAAYRFVTDLAPDQDLDPDGADWASLVRGRAVDGHALAAAMRGAGGVPAGIAASAEVAGICTAWLAWYAGGLADPPPTSWIPNRLEYGFAASTGAGAGEAVLASDEYVDGRLDWYDFDLVGGPSLGGQKQSVTVKLDPVMPTGARFGGMPADRFWEFEDARVNLAQVKAGPVDIGRMLLLEFALVYGNDWFVVPVELPIGALFRIQTFTVRDSFGRTADLKRANRGGASPWRMFELTGAAGATADTFLLAPTISNALEGDPLEEVGLIRDEMANMAWAIERRVPGAMGLPIDRYREASLRAATTRLADLSHVQAELIYRVATSVPEHWLPLVPVPAGSTGANFGIVLERRAMLRHVDDGSVEPIHPRGVLLRTDPSRPVEMEGPIRLEDEEVPREGAVLTRTAQFTRWIGGERLHWTGRRKRVGKGEGASGLRFDVRIKKGDLGPG